MKKTIYLLNVDGYAPEITSLTYPLIYAWAEKIGAGVHQIRERKFPGWPPAYEKLQIYDLGREHGNDWNLYVDSDAVVHPECVDFTTHLAKDTVAHNGADMAAMRWKYDKFFWRDGRNIGSCNWLTMASDWCLDLWHPLDDLTLEEALANIYPTVNEQNTGITREHLLDDYVLSRNVARFGLHFTTINSMLSQLRLPDCGFFWHAYTISVEEKVTKIKEVIEKWKLPDSLLQRPTA